ncbi:MAG: competence/damage-inducible protein A [Ignavibacteria bacterium RBG_13_36_8]|nr:MAG: competence/damage-inducible protein A [Ignavibacteria bacterium RBG_13_36_8]
MNVRIITIGDEILSGQTLNTNAAFIGNCLSDLQLDVQKITVVGDEREDILKEFESALLENDIALISGGLGPTHDDITKKCLVDFFETELVMNQEVLTDIKEFFKQRKRRVSKVNEDQALVPKKAKVIRNSKGTAPGLWIEKNKKIFIAMPGVPHELQEMMESSVVPMLKEIIPEKTKLKKIVTLLTTGIPESVLYERLGKLDELLKGAKLAFLPDQFGVKMRLTINGDNEEEVNNRLTGIEQKIRSLVGRYIYGKDNDKIEEIVAKLLIERGLKIAVAESCTGGLISSRLTNISGSSAYFERGLITYSNGSKVELLHVSEDIIQEHGSVSIEVARQMAEGVRATSGTDIGLAATGIMGPTGATFQKSVGIVYVGLADEKICTAKEFHFREDRLLNKDRTAQAVLDMLRRHLLGIPYDE